MRGAIIGVGKVGSLHLKFLKNFKEIKKIYLVDKNPKKISPYPFESYPHYSSLKNKIDFAIISVPTIYHYEVAKFFLKNKIPILVEKPITATLREAKHLLTLSQKNKTLLFVGHTERYNIVYQEVKKNIKNPCFIECHRLSPYPHRSLDISVVSDLMIHDLDILLELVKRKIKKIEAVGTKVLSSTPDIANARIEFEGGCIANLVASRISKERIRKFRIFSPNSYISLDLGNRKIETYRKIRRKIYYKKIEYKNIQPLKKELETFLGWVKEKKISIYSARRAYLALKLALKIQKIIEKNEKNYFCSRR